MPKSNFARMQLAAKAGKFDLVLQLLECDDMQQVAHSQNNYLLYSALWGNRLDVFDRLLKIGVVQDELARTNTSLLYKACEKNREDFVKRLVSFESVLNGMWRGENPLFHFSAFRQSCYRENYSIIRCLLSAVKKYDKDKYQNMWMIIESEYPYVFDVLKERGRRLHHAGLIGLALYKSAYTRHNIDIWSDIAGKIADHVKYEDQYFSCNRLSMEYVSIFDDEYNPEDELEYRISKYSRFHDEHGQFYKIPYYPLHDDSESSELSKAAKGGYVAGKIHKRKRELGEDKSEENKAAKRQSKRFRR